MCFLAFCRIRVRPILVYIPYSKHPHRTNSRGTFQPSSFWISLLRLVSTPSEPCDSPIPRCFTVAQFRVFSGVPPWISGVIRRRDAMERGGHGSVCHVGDDQRTGGGSPKRGRCSTVVVQSRSHGITSTTRPLAFIRGR